MFPSLTNWSPVSSPLTPEQPEVGPLTRLISVFLLAIVSSLSAHGSECTGGPLGARFTTSVERCIPGHIPATEMKKNTGSAIDLDYVSIETVGQNSFSEKDIFTDSSDLIIGIDVTGNTQGHTYLIINGDRIDGRMFFAPDTITEKEWHLSRGLILRYKNVPTENLNKLVQWVKSDQIIKTPTCVVAANIILFEKGGFRGPRHVLTGRPKHYWFPSTFLKFLAKNGLVGTDGQRIHPEIYTINSDIHMFWNHLPTLYRVPTFFFKVLFDPYTWQGTEKK